MGLGVGVGVGVRPFPLHIWFCVGTQLIYGVTHFKQKATVVALDNKQTNL